jgi:hypothetical protein
MTAIYPITLFVVTGVVWCWTSWENCRLVRAFWKRYPDVAQRELPTSSLRHPENTIFFFRQRANAILRADRELWRQRQRLKTILILSAAIPLGGFSLLVALAAVLSNGFQH